MTPLRPKSARVCFLLPVALFLAHALRAAPTPVLSPDEQQRTFQLDPGLRIEWVACEPMVQDPVAMTFDAEGRLWVVEMRGFMPDIDGWGETNANGRVSVLEDLDQDGRMDRATVFLDGLVLPRAVAVTSSGALIAENTTLWWAEDRDGDGRAEVRTRVDPAYGATNAVEHSANGLWRGMDNWYYNAKSNLRYRQIGQGWTREPTEARGQWGLSHDDVGRLFYNYNHSQLHADFAPPSLLGRNPHHQPHHGLSEAVSTNQQVFPNHPTPAANRGYIPGTLDARNRIRTFTSACAPLVYRGNALPAAYHGNAFVCEPVGNLVKRNILTREGLAVRARAASTDREFLASTDERFRPVFLADGPDGALYIADMYRGIIQHKFYMTPYLREQTLERGLEQPIHKGRIWRVMSADAKAPPPRRPLISVPDSEWVASLADPNGWRRDRAQQRLVESRATHLVPALQRMAFTHTNALARLHALWTLHGLEDLPATWFRALEDPDPDVQAAALRMLAMPGVHPLSPRTLEAALQRAAQGNDPRIRLGAALAASQLPADSRLVLLADIASRHADDAILREAVMSSAADLESRLFAELWEKGSWHEETLARSAFLENLATCIVARRDAGEVGALLTRLESDPPALNWKQQALLSGMAVHGLGRRFKPVPLPARPAILSQPDAFTDRAIQHRLAQLERILAWPGHDPSLRINPTQRTLTVEEEVQFVQGRSLFLSICAACHGNDGQGLKPMGPPLVDSDWVLGAEEVLVRILLQGMTGPVRVGDVEYREPEVLPDMPSLAVLDNESMAAVLTYIRRAWGHTADPIPYRRVSRIRVETQGRTLPWTQEELLKLK